MATIRQYFEGIRDERGMARNTATRIGTAFLLLLDELEGLGDEYLSSTGNDTAQGVITFLRGLLLGNGTYGLDADGLARLRSAIFTEKVETAALEVTGWARFEKLVYNMLQVMEQDYQFSGGGDIEEVIDNHDGTYTLLIHKESEDRHTSFSEHDILYGKVDELLGNGIYYTSWMRVCEDGVTLNDGMQPDTVRVELWRNAEVPGQRNFVPKAMMTVARRGNTRDEQRQQFWELSTTDQRLTFYWHVDNPIISDEHYALCLGMLPDLACLPANRDRSLPSLYVNTVYAESVVHITYPLRTRKEDRGEWAPTPTATYDGPYDGSYGGTQYHAGDTISEPYHCGTHTMRDFLAYRLNPSWSHRSDDEIRELFTAQKVELETSRVWRFGCLWECQADGTTAEPGFSDDWLLVSGTGWRVEFAFDRGLVVWCDDVQLRAEARLMIGTSDVTNDVLQKAAAGTLGVQWTWDRLSGEDATQTAADEMWQPTIEGGHHNVLLIDHRLNDPSRRQDCGPLWERLLRVVFRCTVAINGVEPFDGELGLG